MSTSMRMLRSEFWWNGVLSVYQRFLDRKIEYSLDDYPYISQEKFAHESDFQFVSPEIGEEDLGRLLSSRIIYSNADYFESLISSLGDNANDKVVLLGSSDRDFTRDDVSNLLLFRQAYVQNLTFPATNKIRPLPIGLEDPSKRRNGNPELFHKKTTPKNGKVLIGPFRNTHAERVFFLSKVRGRKFTHRIRRVTTRKLDSYMRTHSLVLAPRGNGMDTHRFWEALYRGSVPVVIQSDWSFNIEKMGVPLIQIESWTEENINLSLELWNEESPDPETVKLLWWRFWAEEFEQFRD